MFKTRLLVLAVVILLCITYLHLYKTIPDPPYTIIQLDVNKLTPSILLEKQPIIINQSIINVSTLLSTVFAYNYMMSDEKFLDSTGNFVKALSKYTIITSPFWNANIDISDPNNQDPIKKRFITIKLKRHQVMILPPLWFYRTTTERVKQIRLDDIISLLAYRF